MNSVVEFLKKILLFIELFFAILLLNWEVTLFFGIIALDQFTKIQIMSSMILGESVPIIKDFFHLTYVLNPGAAFGILPHQRAFFLVATAILIGGAIFYRKQIEQQGKLMKSGVICMLSGSVANMIDRMQTGYVVDFLDFKIWTAVFNVADVAIVYGMFVLIYRTATENKK